MLLACGVLTGLPVIGNAESLERQPSLRLSPVISGLEEPPTAGPMSIGPLTPTTTPAMTPRGPSPQLEEDLPPIATIDLTAPVNDLWQRIRNGFSMPNLESPLVAERQAYYLNRPAALKVMTQRSRRYLYHIVTELEKRGMPMELALLPMVESAYNPLAQSPAKALGMWQFIPSTGKNYNLAQNWWLDQRRDIIASTNAALDYLQNIYEMHGDWHLALASYNWGENAVAKAVARNQAAGLPTDYLSLNMPGETRYYVPKLQALKNIIADPALFGIRLDPIPNKPYFDTVDMPATMDVATAAKLAEIPLDEFMALNPAYSRPLMPDNGNASLLLPADRISIFQANVQQHARLEKPLSLWKTATLKAKEKLDAVAARYGISTARLKQINSISSRTKIVPGMTLLVPASPAAANDIGGPMPQPPAELPAAKARSGNGRSAAPVSAKDKGGKGKPPAGKNAKATKPVAIKGAKTTSPAKAATKPTSKGTAKPAGKAAAKPAQEKKPAAGKSAPAKH
ncbi:hypothetical protein DLREEDagrD3_25490 [Denitratisoma sp. agr-D3]